MSDEHKCNDSRESIEPYHIIHKSSFASCWEICEYSSISRYPVNNLKKVQT